MYVSISLQQQKVMAMDASKVVAALERTWRSIRRHHGGLPTAVVIVASGSEGQQVERWGHWAASRWRVEDSEEAGEVLIAGERLEDGAENILETLLHEAAHALAFSRKIQDTSRGGRYHNGRYKKLAEEVGLTVEIDGTYGFTQTELRPETLKRYERDVTAIAKSVTGYRHNVGKQKRGGLGSRLLLECQCDVPRKLRVSPAVVEAGPIICGVCQEEFEAS